MSTVEKLATHLSITFNIQYSTNALMSFTLSFLFFCYSTKWILTLPPNAVCADPVVAAAVDMATSGVTSVALSIGFCTDNNSCWGVFSTIFGSCFTLRLSGVLLSSDNGSFVVISGFTSWFVGFKGIEVSVTFHRSITLAGSLSDVGLTWDGDLAW